MLRVTTSTTELSEWSAAGSTTCFSVSAPRQKRDVVAQCLLSPKTRRAHPTCCSPGQTCPSPPTPAPASLAKTQVETPTAAEFATGAVITPNECGSPELITRYS